MEQLLEGYFLVTKDDLVFEVKGIIHPRNRVIAYLRYVPDDYGDREHRSGKKYRKIYDIQKRNSFLRNHHQEYLWFDPHKQRVMQSVPIDHIDFVLNPIDYLGQLRDQGAHVSHLEQETIGFVETLVEFSGISNLAIGVTGSQLVGLATSQSDIDLVVYGETNGRSIYQSLKDDWNSISKLERYEGNILKGHVEFRWGKSNPWKKWLYHVERNKILQGVFAGYDFFIRLVKLPNEVPWKYGDRSYVGLGEGIYRCLIVDDSQNMFTPCEYIVKCEEYPDLKRIVSYRGRFTEHVTKGMNIEAKGRLENLMYNDGRKEAILILGEKRSDYLLPVDAIQ